MKDKLGKIRVHTDGDAGPYIDVELDRVQEVESILNDLNVCYMKTQGISDAGQPITKIINIVADNQIIEKINARLNAIN